MTDLVQQFGSQFASTSMLEFVAVLLALAYVWLAARQNILCWPSALLSTAIYIGIFWSVALPFHTALNAYYLLMAVYGWVQWRKVNEEGSDKGRGITQWPLRYHVLSIVSLFIGAQVLILLVGEQLDNEYVQLDALITVFSVFTTVLVAHKVIENWFYWIVIDVVAAYLYFAKGLALTGCLFALYSLFALYGYMEWRKSMEQASPVNG